MVKRGGERGVALIFVLALLIVLGTIVTEVARSVRSEAAILASLRARAVARYAAESGILTAAASIKALLDSTRAAPQRVHALRRLDELLSVLSDVPVGSGRFGVVAVDLNARLDLNRTDETTLRGLFAQFTTESRAQVIVEALKQSPVQRLGELALLPGVDDSLALAVAPYLTVWSDGMVNINSASEPVLAALPGIGRAAARSLVLRRQAGDVFTSIDVVRPLLEGHVMVPSGFTGTSAVPRLSTAPSRLMLVGRGWQAGHPLTHEIQAVYAIVGQQLVLQAWQERDL